MYDSQNFSCIVFIHTLLNLGSKHKQADFLKHVAVIVMVIRYNQWLYPSLDYCLIDMFIILFFCLTSEMLNFGLENVKSMSLAVKIWIGRTFVCYAESIDNFQRGWTLCQVFFIWVSYDDFFLKMVSCCYGSNKVEGKGSFAHLNTWNCRTPLQKRITLKYLQILQSCFNFCLASGRLLCFMSSRQLG